MTGEPDSDFAPDRRLHPASLLLRAIEQIPSLVLGPGAIALFAGGVGFVVAIAIAGAGALLAGLFALLYWYRFTYGIDDAQLVIESGVLSRNRRTIPFDRIQDVSIEQRLLARLFRVATVRIETGAGGKDEGLLDAVSIAEAAAMRDRVRRHRAAGQPSAEAATGEDDDVGRALFSMPLGRVLTAGLFNFSLVIFAAIGAVWQYFGAYIPDRYFDPRPWIGEDGAALRGLVSIATVALSIAALVLVGLVTGILQTLAREYGFLLTRTETGLRRERGLFTRTDVVIPMPRIQAAIVSTGLVKKRFGWREMALQSLGTDSGEGTHHVVAPFARDAELRPIFAEIALPPAAEAPAFSRVSPLMILRRGFPATLLLAVLLASAAYASGMSWLWLALPIPALLAAWQHRIHGHARRGGHLFVRNGVRRQGVTVLPRRNIQSVSLSRGPVQRLFGLATIRIGTAGAPRVAPLAIVDLPAAEARALMDGWLCPVAAATRPAHIAKPPPSP